MLTYKKKVMKIKRKKKENKKRQTIAKTPVYTNLGSHRPSHFRIELSIGLWLMLHTANDISG